MPQFPITPTREKILAKIPDYAVTIAPANKRIIISVNGRIIAESDKPLLVQETRHDDVYYLPREDVRMDLLEPNEHSTYCPFKGHANYWSLRDGGPATENLVWSYENPYPEVEGLRHYLSFYPDKVEIRVVT
ncbi:MAG: DUF427 domain-containing protein [Pseudomonadales bacterium]|nr:DUF427 domain-containing protein [Pseudomonadales bacterium]